MGPPLRVKTNDKKLRESAAAIGKGTIGSQGQACWSPPLGYTATTPLRRNVSEFLLDRRAKEKQFTHPKLRDRAAANMGLRESGRPTGAWKEPWAEMEKVRMSSNP